MVERRRDSIHFYASNQDSNSILESMDFNKYGKYIKPFSQ